MNRWPKVALAEVMAQDRTYMANATLLPATLERVFVNCA